MLKSKYVESDVTLLISFIVGSEFKMLFQIMSQL